MKKSLSLSIAEPCHENWSAMTANEQGRHCGSCCKTVIDFEKMSDAELVAFFKKAMKESVCGRLSATQLERPLIVPRVQPAYLKYAAALLVPTLMMAADGYAQAKDPAKMEQCEQVKMGKVALTPVADSIVIKGIVTDVDGKAIPGATVELNNSNAVLTDSTGYFEMKIEGVAAMGTLRASIVGLGSVNMDVTLNRNSGLVKMKIGPVPIFMGMVAPRRK